MDIEKDLIKHLKKFETAPFLFIGSGFSRRYIGLEDWESLLYKFVPLTNKSESYYKVNSNGNLPEMASLLAEETRKNWFDDKKKEELYKEHLTHKDSPLKIEIANYIKGKKLNFSKLDTKLKKEISDLRKLFVDGNECIDGFITTNWDTLIEDLFPKLTKYIGQDELLVSVPMEVSEVYKIHGCVTKPNSLVLTKQDYMNFNERNNYLASKLLAIFIEHPIIFMGYSLRDENVQEILESISDCLTKKNEFKIKNNIIFVERDLDEEFIGDTYFNVGSTSIPIKLIRTDEFSKIYRAISTFKRKFPIKIMRQFKKQIYELIKTKDIKSQIFVQDIESIDSDTDTTNYQFVWGAGVISSYLSDEGYKGVESYELYEDIILDDKNFDCNKIINQSLPQILRSDGYQPIHKYLNESGYLSADKFESLPDNLKSKVIFSYESFLSYTLRRREPEIREKYNSIEDILEKMSCEEALKAIPLLGKNNINIEVLEDFLKDILKDNPYILANRKQSPVKTDLRRLIRILDWLKYGKEKLDN